MYFLNEKVYLNGILSIYPVLAKQDKFPYHTIILLETSLSDTS